MTLRTIEIPLTRRIGPGLRLRSDESLVGRFRAGDGAAFDAIVIRYRQRLLDYSSRVLGRDDAEDVVQDVFVRAHSALLADDRRMALKPWLYRIAHNRCIDLLRRAPQPAELADEQPSADDVARDVQSRADFERLMEDIGRLPVQQRSALVIRELEGLSYEDLATTLETTVPAVKSLLVRARLNLAAAAQARARSERAAIAA